MISLREYFRKDSKKQQIWSPATSNLDKYKSHERENSLKKRISHHIPSIDILKIDSNSSVSIVNSFTDEERIGLGK